MVKLKLQLAKLIPLCHGQASLLELWEACVSRKGGPFNHRRSIQRLYSSSSLSEILERATDIPNTAKGDLDFLSFQRDRLQDVFAGFEFDFCTISIVSIGLGSDAPEIRSICFGLPEEVLENYMRFVRHDEVSPIVYENPGRVVKYTDIVSEKDAEKHPFYLNHLSEFGIRFGTSIGFNYPNHRQTFIAFDYMAGPDNEIWHYFEHRRLELASFPFAQAYLMRSGMIDEMELRRQFTILETMTEAKLANLRKYVNSPHQDLKSAAESLGIRQGTFHDDLRDSRDGILSRLRARPEFAADAKDGPLRVLNLHCEFLSVLKDHTEPLELPG